MTARRQASRVAAAALSLAVCGCSSGSGAGGSGRPVSPVTATITERGGSVSSSTDLLKAHSGQPIALTVTSDAVDEIDVHSVPPKNLAVTPGVKTFTFSVNTPGTVEVESHGLDAMILKLEIS